METLRQGDMTLLQYYTEIEKKLTLITNKTTMTNKSSEAAVLNKQFRVDALQIFISGLHKNLKTPVFSAQPHDLPTALALAQEAEAGEDRYTFATNFARNVAGGSQKAQREYNGRTEECRAVDEELFGASDDENCNFLGAIPCYPMSSEK